MRAGVRRACCLGAAALAGLWTIGCAEHHFEPPDRESQVAEADSAFSLAVFDSVGWENGAERELAGNVVYSTYCRNCHGPLGEGDTEYARARDLVVPSMVTENWALAQARDSVLHQIFVGHAEGMPTWGVAGLTPRQMDAVTYYVLEVLRPEVLGG